MKRTAINLTISLLTFACGFSVASIWNGSNRVKSEQRTLCDQATTPPPSATPTPEPTLEPEIVFGRDRLRLVAEEIDLKSERLRYDIGITYPRIVGSNDRHIRKLNRRIKQLATKQYQCLLTPSKEDLHYYRTGPHPEVFNSLYMDYQVLLATDSVLSIYFEAFSYGIGAAHSVQYSLVVNYDLVSGKEIKLAQLFKRRSKYLEFISSYCTDKLSRDIPEGAIFDGEIAPMDANFESWNLTRNGIRFNFDACELTGCAGGKYEVEIPFSEMNTILNTEMNLLKQLGV